MKAKYAISAFDGEGARRFGGRWNHIGTPMVYTAGSVSLAALEMLVHLDTPEILKAYVGIPVEFDDSLCNMIDATGLPGDWRDDPAPVSTKDIGTQWAKDLGSAVLGVPSTVIVKDTNFLLNPTHPDFPKILVGGFRKF